jgi:hypothetical protein
MESLAAFLVGEHIREIQLEAERERLARLLTSERTLAAWRRHAGTAARRLSAMFYDVASQLDPASCRPSYGRE